MERTDKALVRAFAEVLRRRRRAGGMSQETLAELADVSVRTISFLENSQRQPTLTIIAALSRGLGISISEFAADIEATRLQPTEDLAGQ